MANALTRRLEEYTALTDADRKELAKLTAQMDGKSGKYGTVSGVNGYLPSPLPTAIALVRP